MRRHPIDLTTIEDTQFPFEDELPLPQLSSFYVSPPRSSQRDFRTPESRNSTKAMTTRRTPLIPTDSPLSNKPSSRKRKRKSVFNVDASFTALFDDRLDEDYIPTQLAKARTPKTGRKKQKKPPRKIRTVSPELGGSNRVITDFFPPTDRISSADTTTHKLNPLTSEADVSPCDPYVKKSHSVSASLGDNEISSPPAQEPVQDQPSTPSKTHKSAPAQFKTPTNKKPLVIPSSTPEYTPLGKPSGWRGYEEDSPTSKASLRKSTMQALTPPIRRIKRGSFVIPCSPLDEYERLELSEDCDDGIRGDVTSIFLKSASKSLSTDDDINNVHGSYMTTSPKSIFLEHRASSDFRNSSLSQSEVTCGQRIPFGTQIGTSSSISSNEGEEDDDDDNTDWIRRRERMDHLMGSSCDEIDDRDECDLLQKAQLLDHWGSPGKSISSAFEKKQFAHTLCERASSKVESFYIEHDSQAMAFPATQRPRSMISSIGQSEGSETSIRAKRYLIGNHTNSATSTDSDYDGETEESSEDEAFNDSHAALLDVDENSLSQQVPQRQQAQSDMLPTQPSLTQNTASTEISNVDSENHTQLSSNFHSTQYYMDKLLTESMLESLPLPDFSTQGSAVLSSQPFPSSGK